MFFLSVLMIPQAVYAQVGSMITGSSVALPLTMHLQHIFIGSSLLLSVMCFAWARALRSYSMALLALYFSIKSLAILAADGLSVMVLFTDSSDFLNLEYSLLVTISIIILLRFTAKLFALNKYKPMYYRLLCKLALFLLLTIPVSYFLTHVELWLLTQVLTSFTLLILIYVARQIPENNNRLPVIYAMMLWLQLGFNVVGCSLYFSRFSTPVINAIDMLAFWFMAIMVTYLMGRKYYDHLRDEKLAQQQVLESVKASDSAQRELLTLQQQGQEELECRVQERTLELNIALQELEEANQELKEKNTLDELSGLYNRRYYDKKIMAEFRRSRRNLTPLSLIVVDIDHFKKVNDSYGHLVGDKCIVAVADMIKSLLRRSADVGCRYGGEEFCLILPETDSHGAVTLAEEICQRVRQQPIFDGENTIELTLSCGVSTYQQEKTVSPETIFANADKALYKAKQAGRDQVQIAEI